MLQYPQKITLCGFGGQGIILTAVMLGTAAVTKGDITKLGIPDANTTVSTSTNEGLKVVQTGHNYKVDIDTAITFILDCGDSVDLTTKPSIPLD